MLASVLFAFPAPAQVPSSAEAAIVRGIKELRQVPDAERGQATRKLALEIRQLPAGANKSGFANSLANLATEGDFGHDTLQAVADTLSRSLREQPGKEKNSGVPAPYLELASLARYEHVEVSLDDPLYAAAVAHLDATEKAQAKADFTLSDLDGKAWTLSALKGKVVLVNFWATWCPPCRKEMPDLQVLYDQFRERRFLILAISDESPDKVKPFIAEHQYGFPVLLDPDRKTKTLYSVTGIPKSFIYDRQGKLVAQSIDMRTRRQFLELLQKAGLN